MEENNLLRVELKELLKDIPLEINWGTLDTNLIEATVDAKEYTGAMQLDLIKKGWVVVDSIARRSKGKCIITLKQTHLYLDNADGTKIPVY